MGEKNEMEMRECEQPGGGKFVFPPRMWAKPRKFIEDEELSRVIEREVICLGLKIELKKENTSNIPGWVVGKGDKDYVDSCG